MNSVEYNTIPNFCVLLGELKKTLNIYFGLGSVVSKLTL